LLKSQQLNFMRNRDTNAIFENYRGVIHNRSLLTEKDKQQDTQKQLNDVLKQPDVKKSIEGGVDQLLTKYAQQIQAAQQQGPEAIQKLLQQIEAELENASKQADTPTQNEGVINRAISNVAGAYNTIKGSGNNNNLATNAMSKRFDILQKNIGKDLKELQRDMQYTSNVNNTVRDQINQMVTTLGTPTNGAAAITPQESKIGDIMNKIGHIGMTAVPSALFSFAIAPAIATVAPAAAVGIPTKMLVSGITGATMSILNDKINGRKTDWATAGKKGLASALTSGAIGLAVGGLQHALGGGAPAAPTANMGAGTQGNLSTPGMDVTQDIGMNQDVNNITGAGTATAQGVPNVNVDNSYNWGKVIKSAIGQYNPSSDVDQLKLGIAKNIAKIAQRTDLGLPPGFKLTDSQLADIYNKWAEQTGNQNTTDGLARAFTSGKPVIWNLIRAVAKLPPLQGGVDINTTGALNPDLNIPTSMPAITSPILNR